MPIAILAFLREAFLNEQLIDRIYECGFVPELWPEVLRDASKASRSAGASLYITNPEITAWTASKNAQDIASRFVAEGWFWRGQLVSRIHNTRHAGFVRDIDLMSAEELAEEPIYRDSWRKLGLGWGAATALALPTGELLTIVMARRNEAGPATPENIEALDMLRPHLARSAMMAARLRMERAKAAGDTLAALGLPALVLNKAGKVIAANRLIEGGGFPLHWRAGDRVTLSDLDADRLLRAGLAPSGPDVRSFPVRDGADTARLVGHLIPLCFSARDVFARGDAVFVLTPVAAPEAPSVELVQALFDLTAAEARVARGLAGGKTVEDLASDGQVSSNTVRVQVRGVLEKTGCHRQTDVVALLAGLSAPGRRE